jgi:DNA-binding CsgD family transcriptional regulator
METLTPVDAQALHRSIQQLYTFHQLDTFQLGALDIINQLVPSDFPCFHTTNLATRQITSTFQPDFPGWTSEMTRVMLENFGEHPIIQHMPLTLSGAYKISDFIKPQELYRLEGFYQQHLGLFGIEDQMVYFLPPADPVGRSGDPQPPAPLSSFALHRPERSFTERDRLMLNLLRPHLAQAYSNLQHLQTVQQSAHQLQKSLDCLGVIVLDATGHIQSLPPQAARWLHTYFTPSTSPRQLPDRLWSWVKHQIHRLSSAAHLPTATAPLCVQLADQQLSIRLTIEQVGARYLLLLEERPISPVYALEALGLSARETELLRWVMQGEDNAAIAAHMGISLGTVRKHLENLYRKLDATSRADAMSRVLRKLGLFNSSPLS